MIYYAYAEDAINVRTNSYTVVGGLGIAYNAVISVKFSAESSTEPITLPQAKDWLRVDINDDDDLITLLIKSARIACERYANQSFITRTVTAKIHNGLGNFNLPYGPVVNISSIKDGDNVVSNYDLSDSYGSDLTVVYTAGYSTLPEDIVTAIKNQIAFMYEKRGSEGIATGLSFLSQLILEPIRNV